MNYKKLMKKIQGKIVSFVCFKQSGKKNSQKVKTKTKEVKDKKEITSNITRKEMNGILVLCTLTG